MKVQVLPVGPLQANCYLLTKASVGLLIDPGDEIELIQKLIGTTKILAILVTHHHFDHVGALKECQKKYAASVIDFASSPIQTIGPFSFTILKTSGHSKDSASFYFKEEELLFSGDFLFYHTIGRTDLPGGSNHEMKESIKQMKTYSPSIRVNPGHGISTTLKEEFKNNPYFQ